MEEYKTNQSELEQIQNNDVAPVQNKKKFLLVWKIIVAVLYAAITGFLVWSLFDALASLNDSVPEGQLNFNGLGYGLYLIIVVLILGSIVYAVNAILSIVGLVVSVKKDAGIGTKIYFIIFIVLPIITEIIIFIVAKALGTNG